MEQRLAEYYRDTDPRALEVFLSLHRCMSDADKIAAVFQMNEMLYRLAEDSVRREYPAVGEREVFLRTAARYLDRDTMKRAYGWDPESATP
jgi:hypothetical protein